MEPPWDEGMKDCSNGPGHMTNMAAMPIYGKTLKMFFSGKLKVGVQHWVLKYYPVCSYDDPELTLTYFMTMSNLVSYAFVWEKGSLCSQS